MVEIHPQLQGFINIEDGLKRDRAMGFLGLSDDPELIKPAIVDPDDGFPLWEIWSFGSATILLNEFAKIIKEYQAQISKMERDHAETISELYNQLDRKL